MRMRLIAALAVFAAFAQQPKRTEAVEYPSPLIREQVHVVVAGVDEIWQLRWRAKPKPSCSAAEGEGSLACPCAGFAYGEEGDFDVVRIRGGVVVIDRLDVGPFFTERRPTIQRWATDIDKDFPNLVKGDYTSVVSKRPVVQIMHFADYNHDGWSTGFYIQTEAMCNGTGVVVGISKDNRTLHAFGTVRNPNKPLFLHDFEWEALRKASSPITVDDLTCGEHGSDETSEIRLRWNAKGIDGEVLTYACTDTGQPGRLLSVKPL